MAAILYSAMLDADTGILDSDTLLSSLRFTQKHSPSNLTLTQSHSFSLNLMMATILNSVILNLVILDSALLVFPLNLTHTFQDWFPPFRQKNFTHSFWLNLMMAAILNSALMNSAILHKMKFTHFLLTQLDGGIHLEFFHLDFCHLGFSHFAQKKISLIHSDSTWWWQPSWILPCWIQTLPSWIQTPCYLLSDSLKTTLTPFWLWLKQIQSDSNSFILI